MSAPIINQETIFKFNELFFSSTDGNGRILNGNEVFARISGYNRNELINQPHSIIRHPDMPRVVFRLLWSEIQSGKSIAAFVKNRSKDGRYYWVMAYVMPVGDTYLSVRFKPGSAYLEKVAVLYDELRAVEKKVEMLPGSKKDEAIQASHDLLNQRLSELGYNSYQDFIQDAFLAEFANWTEKTSGRNSVENHTAQDARLIIMDYLGTIMGLSSEVSSIENQYSRANNFIQSLTNNVQMASLNLSVRSEHLGDLGATLSVVSLWLQRGSLELHDELLRLDQPIQQGLEGLKAALFEVATSQLQIKMISAFNEELRSLSEDARGYSTVEANGMMQLLSSGAERNFNAAREKLGRMGSTMQKIHHSCSDLLKQTVALGLAQVNGRVECARMPDVSSFEAVLNAAMEKISDAKDLLKDLSFASACLADTLKKISGRSGEIQDQYRKMLT